MDFFINNAYAQQAAPQGSLIDLWPLVVIFIAFYFLLIRPQQKKQKAHTEMVGALHFFLYCRLIFCTFIFS